MRNLKNLENAAKKAANNNRGDWITVSTGLKGRGQDESKYYLADGKEYTGPLDLENIIIIEYDKAWGKWKEPAAIA